jgi:UPF0755 protein
VADDSSYRDDATDPGLTPLGPLGAPMPAPGSPRDSDADPDRARNQPDPQFWASSRERPATQPLVHDDGEHEHLDHDEFDAPIFGRQRAVSPQRRHRRNQRILIVLAAIILVFVVLGGWVLYELHPPGGAGAPVDVQITKGMGLSEIGDALDNAGVIGSPTVFEVYAKLTGAGPFRAGTYHLHKDLGVSDAIDALQQQNQGSPVAVVKLNVGVPGLRLDQIADMVVKEFPRLSKTKFLAIAHSDAVRSRYEPATVHSVEGLTYPAVYDVTSNVTEQAILEMMVSKFDAVATDANVVAGAQRLNITPYQAMIVASLIQREAGVPADRPDVYNRLKQNMPLQIDATVVYARGGGPGAPTKADLAIDSPYNTYKVKGLPPTPICNFIPENLTAALNPTPNVGFLFYVLIDKSGRHAFSDTYAEQQANITLAKSKGLL